MTPLELHLNDALDRVPVLFCAPKITQARLSATKFGREALFSDQTAAQNEKFDNSVETRAHRWLEGARAVLHGLRSSETDEHYPLLLIQLYKIS